LTDSSVVIVIIGVDWLLLLQATYRACMYLLAPVFIVIVVVVFVVVVVLVVVVGRLRTGHE